MSTFGEQSRSAAPAAPVRPLGIGRGSRPPTQKFAAPPSPTPQNSIKTESSTKQQAKEALLKDNYEFLTDVIKKLINEKIEPSRELVSDEFAKLTGNTLGEVAKALGLKTEEAMLSSFGINLPEDGSSVPLNVLHKPPYSLRRTNAKSKSRRSIRIPLAKGESVVAYLDSDTCWVPLDLLSKIYQCPKASFKDVCKSSTGQNGIPKDSICFSCLLSIREQHHGYLSAETQPILENLRKLLNNYFRSRNGYELGRFSSCT